MDVEGVLAVLGEFDFRTEVSPRSCVRAALTRNDETTWMR